MKQEDRISAQVTGRVYIDLTLDDDDEREDEDLSIMSDQLGSLLDDSIDIERLEESESDFDDDGNTHHDYSLVGDNQTLTPVTRVAKMLVNHFIRFKGCKRHTAVIGEDITGLHEFICDRQELLRKIPSFDVPDFAHTERVPIGARFSEREEILDEWRKLSQDPLDHMTLSQWKECYPTIQQIFTGGDDSDEEDGLKLDRYLEIGKGDMMFANSRRRREMAHGTVTLDIDSILALFTDLYTIKMVIAISIIANPMKNLKRSVHLIHNGIPLHWIPHFHLGEFGHDPTCSPRRFA